MSKISQSVVSRDAHIKFVSQLVVKGDAAAIAILSSPAALAQDYIAFADRQARNHKLQFVDVIGVLSDDDVDSLRKSLPKDSAERVRFLDAMKAVQSDKPCTWTLHAAGTLTIRKEPTNCAMIVAVPILNGKAEKQMKGLKFWRWIASLTPADFSALHALLADADAAGMK